MKYLILLLSFSLPVFANLEAVNCSSILTKNGCSAYNGFFIGEEGSKFRVCQIKTNGYKVTIRKPKKSNPDGDQCNYNVTPKGFESESPEDNRHYSLADSGSFGVHVSFPSKMPKGSGLSRTTGAKSFYFLPKKQENKLLIDPENNELAFELQNGSRIYFNPKTGLIDEDLTTDFDVEQTPIKANSAGVIIKNPKRVMLTFPYQTGSAPTSNRNIDLVVEKEGLGCRIKAKKFFNYEFSCSQKAPCNCAPGQSYCTATAEESVGFRRSSIDGIELKEYSLEDQNQILSYNGCSKIQMANEETSDQLLTSEIVKKQVVTPSKIVDREPVKIEKKSENNSKELNVLKVPRANPVHAQSAKFIGGNLVVDEDVLYNNVSHPPLIKKEEATSSGRPHSAKFIGKNLFVDEDVLFNNISQLPEIKELSYKTSLVLPRVLELMEPEGVEVKPAVVEDPSDSQLEQDQKEVQDDHEQVLKRSVAGNQCQQRVVEFFGDEANKDLVNNYIKIQSKIALHRVAWTYLKSSQGDTKNFEASIKELLLKRDPKLHEKFVNSKQFSRNERLLAVMSELKDASSEFETKKDEPYTIKYSDVKMIDLLVEAENQHGRSYDNGIMDFTSIIRNSMKSRLNTKDANIGKIEAQLDILESKKDKLDEQLMSYLSKFNCDEQVDFGACGPKNIKSFDIGKGLEEFEALIDSVYEKQFEKSKELKNNFRWNTYWLHVR